MSTTAIPGAPDDVVRVFVSYAREDRRWLDPDYRYSLIPFLMESLRRHKVVFWFDKELKPGDEFRRFIESEIDQSQIALLIVSQSFLNSEFIENREMPRIAERARLGKMIVVPVLVEPCDWSEYPFLADRQMVPSSPLIEYTESEPQWAKVRFQILDGLKAQLKRIREAPQSPASSAAAQEAAEREAAAQSASRAEQEAEQIRQQREREAEERRKREKEREGLRLREAAEREIAAQAATRAEAEAEQIRQQQEQEARASKPVPPPVAEPDVSRGSSSEPNAKAGVPVSTPVDISKPAPAPTEIAPEVSNISEPVWVPTFGMATTPPEPKEESQDQAQVSAVERMRASTPRNWASAVLGGMMLVGVVALVLLCNTLPSRWLLSAMGGAPLAAALVCLLVFKPFPRNWSLAAVGGVALVSAVWVYLAFSRLFPLIWTDVAMDGAALAMVLVCLRVFRPFPGNWIPAAVGGVGLVGALALPSLWLYYLPPLWIVIEGAPLAMVLVCFLVFKPFPRNWTPAVVGGAALASAMWVYIAFIRWFGVISILALAAIGGAALAAVFVCRMVFKPYPRNWIPDFVGGAALVSAMFVYHVFLREFRDWTLPAMDEAALAMMLVCLLVFKAREKT